MFNVGVGEIVVIVLVCLLVFGPDRLPEMARKAGRFVSQVRFMAQNALDQLKEEADLKDINLPDLQVGSLRQQARDYIRELMDIEGQLAELQQARTELEAAVKGQSPNGGEQAEKAKEDGAPPAPPPVDLDAT